MLLRHMLGVACGGLWTVTQAIQLDVTDKSSIIAATIQASDNALTFYHGNDPGGTPGLPDQPYYWWEGGGLMGLLIQKWSLTGNDSLNPLITQAIQFQVGQYDNFEPANQSFDLGNDDQAFWALSAMDAAEFNFPNPPAGDPSWTSLAQAVFNRQTGRWDPSTCGGGIAWQVIPWHDPPEYKNTISNGNYFQLAARLARYTGNSTYATNAEKMYDWIAGSAIYENQTSFGLQIWDGFWIKNCTSANERYWTYNSGTMLMGAAYMFNYTNGSDVWRARIGDILGSFNVYFVQSVGAKTANVLPPPHGQIMAEVACETTQSCNQDQPSFKAYTARWLAMTTQLAPFTGPIIWPWLLASAQAAAGQCIGSASPQTPQTVCGRRWYQTTWDGFSGLGEQMSAFSIFQNLLINGTRSAVTTKTGGTSKGNSGAGNDGPSALEGSGPWLTDPITVGDQAGAGILTVLGVACAAGGFYFMIW